MANTQKPCQSRNQNPGLSSREVYRGIMHTSVLYNPDLFLEHHPFCALRGVKQFRFLSLSFEKVEEGKKNLMGGPI